MSLQLSQHSLLLLPAQLRLNGNFTYHAYDNASGIKVPFTLQVEQQPIGARLTITAGHCTDTLTLHGKPDAAMAARAQAFLLDSLNGTLDSASGRVAA